jgi:hypothetical protein
VFSPAILISVEHAASRGDVGERGRMPFARAKALDHGTQRRRHASTKIADISRGFCCYMQARMRS